VEGEGAVEKLTKPVEGN